MTAARELGVRIVASRGSMDLGASEGGLPPDELVEAADDALADTERLRRPARARARSTRPDRRRALLARSPSRRRLMVESAELARRLGLRLHTHLAETVEEEAYCRELYGCTPVEYLAELGWLDDDVWCAHCVHLSEGDIARFARAGHRRRRIARPPTCASGPASPRCAAMLDAGVPVGLGVDGSASNERSDLCFEVKQALLVARGRDGPQALTAREALRLATRGGARVLGRDDIGSLEPGKCADLAVWPHRSASSWQAPTTPSQPSSSRARSGSTASTWAARRSYARAGFSARTRPRSRASSGPRPRGSRRLRERAGLDLDARARYRARRARDGRSGRALARRRPGPRRTKRTPTDALPTSRPAVSSPAGTASSSTRRRRSSGASSSRSSSTAPRATTTCRSSSPRTRARATAAVERRGARGALRGPHALRRAAGRTGAIRSRPRARSSTSCPRPSGSPCSTPIRRSAHARASRLPRQPSRERETTQPSSPSWRS